MKKRIDALAILIAILVLISTTLFADQTSLFKPNEGGFIRDWLICGPFPNLEDPEHKEEYLGFSTDWLSSKGGEEEIMPEIGMEEDVFFPPSDYWTPCAITVTWKESHDKEDMVNLFNYFMDTKALNLFSLPFYIVGYAACYIHSEEEREALLSIGSDDGFKVWLNHTLIGAERVMRGSAKDQNMYNVRLKKGVNSLLLKVDQIVGGYSFYFRFLNLQKEPIKDIRIGLTPPLEKKKSKYRKGLSMLDIRGKFNAFKEKDYYDDNEKINFIYKTENLSKEKKIVETVFKVSRDEKVITTSKEKIELSPGKHSFFFSWDTDNYPAGWYMVRAFVLEDNEIINRGGTAMIHKVSSFKMNEKLVRIKKNKEELNSLIQELKEKKIDISYPLVTLTTLQEVIPCVEVDIKERKFPKAGFILDYLETSSQKGIEEAKELFSGKKKAPNVPQYDLSNLKIKKGFFYKGDEPIILLGVLPPQYYDRHLVPEEINCYLRPGETIWSILSRGYGFSLTQIWGYGYKGGRVQMENHLTYPLFLEQIKEANLSFSFLLTPAINIGTGSFGALPKRDFPLAEIRDSLKAVIPAVKDSSYLSCYDLHNEFSVSTLYDPSQFKGIFQQWLAYLEKKYKDITLLNEIWNTGYKEFSEVTLSPEDKANYPKWYDWELFNTEKIFNIFSSIKEIIREMDSDTPITIELSATHGLFGKHYSQPSFSFWGMDWERLGKMVDILGVDEIVREGLFFPKGIYAMNWQWQPMVLDFLKSLYPDKPIFNPEYHLFNTRIKGDVPKDFSEGYTKTSCFIGAFHGLAAATTWLYEREHTFRGIGSTYHLLDVPRHLEALARTSLDLRRLSKYIVPFSQVKGDIAILYSSPSLLKKECHDTLGKIYESLYFTGLPVRFITENQIAEGKLSEYRLLIIPQAEQVYNSTYKRIEKYLKRGGEVVIIGENSLSEDEYRRKRGFKPLLEKLKGLKAKDDFFRSEFGKGRIYFLSSLPSKKELFTLFNSLFEEMNISPVIKPVDKEGKSIFGVESRTIPFEGGYLTYLINLTKGVKEVRLVGKEITKVKDLMQDKEIENSIRLKPLSPVILELIL